jgi:hypothetical protein
MATAPSSAYLRYHFNKKVVDKAPVRTSSTINLSMFTSLDPTTTAATLRHSQAQTKPQLPVALAPSSYENLTIHF